jgi:hypothetical protein
MARGWESKAIEDQIAEAEAKRQTRAREALTPAQVELRRRKESLMLERTRLIRELERGHKRRYLVLVEKSLAHIEAQLAGLEEMTEQETGELETKHIEQKAPE